MPWIYDITSHILFVDLKQVFDSLLRKQLIKEMGKPKYTIKADQTRKDDNAGVGDNNNKSERHVKCVQNKKWSNAG